MKQRRQIFEPTRTLIGKEWVSVQREIIPQLWLPMEDWIVPDVVLVSGELFLTLRRVFPPVIKRLHLLIPSSSDGGEAWSKHFFHFFFSASPFICHSVLSSPWYKGFVRGWERPVVKITVAILGLVLGLLRHVGNRAV